MIWPQKITQNGPVELLLWKHIYVVEIFLTKENHSALHNWDLSVNRPFESMLKLETQH